MSIKYQYIKYILLLSPNLLFAAHHVPQQANCIDHIPNSRNFIISGKLFRKTIHCLENVINQQNKALREKLEAKHPHANISETKISNTGDTASAFSVALETKTNAKKVLLIAYTHDTEKKVLTVELN